MSDTIFLSYPLTPETPTYGNYSRVELSAEKSQARGDSSNVTGISINSHVGTHVDFPRHFISDGKSGDDYPASAFIFENVLFMELSLTEGLIETVHLEPLLPTPYIDFLLIKTGMGKYRYDEKYWQDYPGIAADCAPFLKERFPALRAIGFDFISISSIKNREEGRRSHVEFLDRDIWIVEDMNLGELQSLSNIRRLTLAPLLFKECDGAPCTIIAELE